jgi:hypothetical protein
MEKNKKIGVFVLILVLMCVTFYGGVVYGKSKNINNSTFAQSRNFSQSLAGMRNGRGNMGGLISGEILSKDNQSIVIKMRDGGSKIVILTNTTMVSKNVDGTLADLEIGKQVSVNGETNSDGSVSAQSVQIRPNMPQNMLK